jgi:hypothetical protein
MPNKFHHIGLIHLMPSNVKIIDMLREPMACCFSNLKQLFASGQEFTYSIEDTARYYLEFSGLEFEPACVEFYKSDRSVYTASSEQVRQPIFREGLLQWRNYQPFLVPLRNALGDALINHRESPR